MVLLRIRSYRCNNRTNLQIVSQTVLKFQNRIHKIIDKKWFHRESTPLQDVSIINPSHKHNLTSIKHNNNNNSKLSLMSLRNIQVVKVKAEDQ